jgi:hypothetical protein
MVILLALYTNVLTFKYYCYINIIMKRLDQGHLYPKLEWRMLASRDTIIFTIRTSKQSTKFGPMKLNESLFTLLRYYIKYTFICSSINDRVLV